MLGNTEIKIKKAQKIPYQKKYQNYVRPVCQRCAHCFKASVKIAREIKFALIDLLWQPS